MEAGGGAEFYKSVKIGLSSPPLRIKTVLKRALLSLLILIAAILEVTFTAARNLKVEMQAKFSQQTTTFKNYPKYNS
jgi:hypothetical protein